MRIQTTTLAAFAALMLAAQAQEPDVRVLPPGEQPPTPEANSGAASQDPQQRLRQLFGEVERTLESIDILLTDAAAGDTSGFEDLEDAGIDRLLRNSVEAGRQAQRDIEEIIRIAQEMSQQPSSAGSGGSGQSPGGESQGSPTSRGQGSQSSEQTPELPEESAGGEEQGQQQGQDGEQQDQAEGGDQPEPGEAQPEGGGKPDSPLGSDEDGRNRSGEDPSGAQTGRAGASEPDPSGWGNLPQHVRDTFRAEGRGDLPARYRDWIDSYYHKLNRRSDGR